jgi:hypothetical protein
MTEKISDAWKIYRGLAVAQLNKKRGGHYRCMLDLVGSLLDGYLDRDKSPAPQDDKYLNILMEDGWHHAIGTYSFLPAKSHVRNGPVRRSSR